MANKIKQWSPEHGYTFLKQTRPSDERIIVDEV